MCQGSPPSIRAGRRKRRGRSNSSSTRQTVSIIPIRPSPLSRGLQPSPSGSFSRSSAKSHRTRRAIRPKGRFRVAIGPQPSAQLLSGPRSAACPRGRPTKPEQCGARSVSGQTCAHLPANRGTHVSPALDGLWRGIFEPFLVVASLSGLYGGDHGQRTCEGRRGQG